MIDKIYAAVCDILARVIDTQSRAARIETRLMRLAEALHVNVTKKETDHEHLG